MQTIIHSFVSFLWEKLQVFIRFRQFYMLRLKIVFLNVSDLEWVSLDLQVAISILGS